jgi:glyoxylase-like metal-dependent hydrolase (beta-lactamase superfamily II)
VHVHETEYRAVTDPAAEHHRHSLDRFMTVHRTHGPRWSVARSHSADTWFGFEGVATLRGLSDEIALVPLPGHTPGHSGVAVRQSDRWVLHAGDAYFYHGEVAADPPQIHPELQMVQNSAQVDPERRLNGLHRLRDLFRRHADEVRFFCAHDPWEFQREADRQR